MALDFPDSPTVGQIFNTADRDWIWTGVNWDSYGSPGTTIVLSYVHNQGAAAASWVITHNLGWYPNVKVVDSGGANVEGDVAYTNLNSLTITFSAAFSGIAYLS